MAYEARRTHEKLEEEMVCYQRYPAALLQGPSGGRCASLLTPQDAKPLGVITLTYPLDVEGHRAREVHVIPEEDEAGPKKKFCFEIRGVYFL